jgi:hypothetical protein
MCGQVRRIHIIHRHPRDQPGPQQRAQRGKYQPLIALFFHIIKQNVAQQIARKWGYSAATKPGGFAGTRQTDSKDHKPFWRAFTSLRRRRNRRLRLRFNFKATGSGRLVPLRTRLLVLPRLALPALLLGLAIPLRPRIRSRTGRLWTSTGLVRIMRNKRGRLVWWKFLAYFARGFGGIGTAFGPSSHAKLNTFVADTGIIHDSGTLQIRHFRHFRSMCA